MSAGVCKADWRVRTGNSQWLTCPFPVTVGYESAGIIEALGPGVTGFTVGQPVHVLHMAVYGTNADYMAVTADDVAPLPEGMDFDAAAAAFNYFVAWGLLNQIVQASAGQTLYIGGAAGGIGTAVIQLAQHQGVDVIASASTEVKCDYLRGLGVEKVFNYKDEDDVAAVKRLSGGRGVDYVYDQVAGPGLLPPVRHAGHLRPDHPLQLPGRLSGGQGDHPHPAEHVRGLLRHPLLLHPRARHRSRGLQEGQGRRCWG